ncbi:MAG: hypothetical protein HQL31_07735, partial [Planctomycetes bacterium]|nr:hypothetical protein [Planctomycetota bacterium]
MPEESDCGIDRELAELLIRQVDPELRRDFARRAILSASGFRFICSGDEEDLSGRVPPECLDFVLCALHAFADRFEKGARIYIGRDTRPSGPLLLNLVFRVLEERGLEALNLGTIPAPQIMAATHILGADGFFYLTASHNPPGHNGLKFGMADGAVLAAAACREVAANTLARYADEVILRKLREALGRGPTALGERLAASRALHGEASLRAYRDFVLRSAHLSPESTATLRSRLTPIASQVILDMNGSARLLSCDAELLEGLGFRTRILGGKPGTFLHRIVPEGESLEDLRSAMQARIDAGEERFCGLVP